MTVDTAYPPRLAAGIELLGELKDSGFAEPQSLIRRADGQVIQLSRLLYLVSCLMDGTRGAEDIAAAVSAELGRTLTGRPGPLPHHRQAGAARHRRGPGRTRAADGQPAARAQGAGDPAARAAACAAGTFLRPLFRLPVIVAVIVSVAALDFWIFTTHGLAPAFRQVLNDPVDLLLVAGLSIVSALFHECGHAAGCRYGGARPGRIGAGIYLVWPAFFTNVTDSYRLSRAGRLRTDLGGLYFNMIFMLVLAAFYAATSAEILLLVIAITHLEMLEQLLPFVRFDGYFILSDLVGVPDLFARVAPVLRSCLSRWQRRPARHRAAPQRQDRDHRVGAVRHPAARAHPGVPPAAPAGGQPRAVAVGEPRGAPGGRGDRRATGTPRPPRTRSASALALVSIAGSLYVTVGLVRRAVAFGRALVGRPPRRRLLALLAGVACAVPLSVIWLVQGQFSDW